MTVLFTIGHSNHAIEAFVALLHRHSVDCVVDVRSYPVSRRYPWFEADALRQHLATAGIDYHHAGRPLGGKRPVPQGSPHIALEAQWHGYADHMLGQVFRRGIAQLRRLSESGTVAIMCAERDPSECHRSMISDHLHFEGVPVHHILADGRLRDHQPNPAIRLVEEGLIYDHGGQVSLLPG